MRLGCAVLVAVMLTPAAGQRGGGMHGGGIPGGGLRPGFPSSMPNPPQMSGRGGWGFGRGNRGNFWRGPRTPRVTFFNWPYAPWLDPYGCEASPFPSYWNNACGMYSNQGAYPDPAAFQGMNEAPPQPLPPPEPMIGMETQPSANPTPLPPSPANGGATVQPSNLNESPSLSRGVVESYPALIAFKAGGMYSATEYWVKNKKLCFTTTLGENLCTPVSEVERIYPAQSARIVR